MVLLVSVFVRVALVVVVVLVEVGGGLVLLGCGGVDEVMGGVSRDDSGVCHGPIVIVVVAVVVGFWLWCRGLVTPDTDTFLNWGMARRVCSPGLFRQQGDIGIHRL